ncbi:hypothetical protein BpHYR1_044447 [Brachionus plicatilis]|uniref:Uncharacterized protein n=1 Tax=Brachionus plicatilis TaxID=10195 RepID=A0A3M7QRU1_BRAPC|nr:hypothetical protein BpHYR1_044447 [Brachionus plicatilis]
MSEELIREKLFRLAAIAAMKATTATKIKKRRISENNSFFFKLKLTKEGADKLIKLSFWLQKIDYWFNLLRKENNDFILGRIFVHFEFYEKIGQPEVKYEIEYNGKNRIVQP